MEIDEGTYENPWTYEGANFTSDDINDFFGYVYRITNLTTGKQYIGRKYFTQRRKPRSGKGKRRVTTESDWKSTTEVLQNLRPMLRLLENPISNERSYPSIPDSEM